VTEVDRARAIQYAIEEALADDVVLIAGKGHERYQEIAGLRHAFDDAEEAAACLRSWRSGKAARQAGEGAP
jgi:UDP-N-acetylmuramoyl-L-alanyl-D-glutamate--2,6-diaminopimelate ligase